VAPPKRKTSGGRVTPKGTKPGHLSEHAADPDRHVEGSTRYTPPKAKYEDESPPWYPYLVFGLLGAGGITILTRYLVWNDSNLPVAIGLVLLLAGLWAATRWK
jgi:Cell division protein CrgA